MKKLFRNPEFILFGIDPSGDEEDDGQGSGNGPMPPENATNQSRAWDNVLKEDW